MKVALDTNILVYVERLNDPTRESKARSILERLPVDRTVIPIQVLGELYNVLRRKARLSTAEVARSIDGWAVSGELAPTSVAAFGEAIRLAGEHGLQVWDAFVLAVAAEAGCSVLLSEDLQHGFAWRGVTVVNPFLEPTHDKLQQALANTL